MIALDADGHWLCKVSNVVAAGCLKRGEASPTSNPDVIQLRGAALSWATGPGLTHAQQVRRRNADEGRRR